MILWYPETEGLAALLKEEKKNCDHLSDVYKNVLNFNLKMKFKKLQK